MLARYGFTGLKEEDLGKLHEVDQYEEELIVMAETLAYFHVAYKVCYSPTSLSHHLMAVFTAHHRQYPTDY